MERVVISAFVLFFIYPGTYAQDHLTLHECYERAESNYPLTRQRELIEKSSAYLVENIGKGSLPQLSIGGQATWQSEVTRIPVEMPGVEPLSKDQYRLFGEVSQTVYHGGVVNQQQRAEELNGMVERQALTVELYQLKNRINELFFGILLLQDQIAQTELMKDDIRTALRKTEAAVINGVALRSAADVLQAELLRMDQRVIDLQSSQEGHREVLGLFINRTIGSGTVLEKPEIHIAGTEVDRPELTLYDYQKQGIGVQRALLSSRKKPKVDLFVQGGYGRPALNMLENEFAPYFLGGIRFSWMLSSFYTFGREKQLLVLREHSVDVKEQTFLFNTRLNLVQQNAEITRLQRLIQIDKEIIGLRTVIKATASAQLEQGVITSADYVREVNAEDQAKQSLVLHETQLLMAVAKHQLISGN